MAGRVTLAACSCWSATVLYASSSACSLRSAPHARAPRQRGPRGRAGRGGARTARLRRSCLQSPFFAARSCHGTYRARARALSALLRAGHAGRRPAAPRGQQQAAGLAPVEHLALGVHCAHALLVLVLQVRGHPASLPPRPRAAVSLARSAISASEPRDGAARAARLAEIRPGRGALRRSARAL